MKHLPALSLLLALALTACDVATGNADAPCDIFGTWEYQERTVIDGDGSTSKPVSGYLTLTNDSRWSRDLYVDSSESKGVGLFDVIGEELILKGFDHVRHEGWVYQALGRTLLIDSLAADGTITRYELRAL